MISLRLETRERKIMQESQQICQRGHSELAVNAQVL